MRTWGLWRWSPAPKKWMGDIQLPWSYLDAEPLEGEEYRPREGHGRTRGVTLEARYRDSFEVPLREGLNILEHDLRRAKIPTDGQVRDSPIGAMRTLRIAITHRDRRVDWQRRSRESLYWLVPPLFRFADLDKHFDPDEVADVVGPGQFYANTEIYEAAGQFIQGDLFGSHHVLHGADLIYAADLGAGSARVDKLANEMREFVSTALDSFLERREIDPRFNPSGRGAAARAARRR